MNSLRLCSPRKSFSACARRLSKKSLVGGFLAMMLAGVACQNSPKSTQEKETQGAGQGGAGGQAAAFKKESAQAQAAKTSVQDKEENLPPLAIRRAHYAILKLRLAEAQRILEAEVGPLAAIERARLAIYRADCEGARSQLTSPSVREHQYAGELVSLSERCFGATAGSSIIDDKQSGIWLRLQDESDRVLAPLIIRAAQQARSALEKDLGEQLPRPLKIDLVRDLFSLSSVSGLPLEAAETTGTVAVARWGRVTMVSPRAMRDGFPWADTLAHEITHLLISKATADRAPLWLQEGIAKREERRWREAQAFDDEVDFSKRAFDAQLAGKSVGVDKIGPSIAMLPSAEAASIAFSEVTSFMDFWIQKNGPRSLEMLLREMEIAQDADQAMRGVSAFSVSEWQRIWRDDLQNRYAQTPMSEEEELNDEFGPHQLSRSLRLVELLTVDGHSPAAELRGAIDLDRASHSAALRFLTARAALLNDSEESERHLGSLQDVRHAEAGWLALYAREVSEASTSLEGQKLADQARSLDPLLAEAACGGVPWVGKTTTPSPAAVAQTAENEALCRAARSLPVRGSR